MTSATLQKRELPFYGNPWEQWNEDELRRYDKERPADYEELRKDAVKLIREVEKKVRECQYEKNRRGVGLYAMLGLAGGGIYETKNINGIRLLPEMMAHPVVRKFFRRTKDESFVMTNSGEALPISFCRYDHKLNFFPQEVSQLLYHANHQKPRSPEEAFKTAELNHLIFRGAMGRGLGLERYGFLKIWRCLPEDRQAEDALLYTQNQLDPETKLSKDLFAWASEADEDAGIRLGRRILGGVIGINTSIYNALLLDNDFKELLREKF